jgi:hypothetical protein
LQLIQPDGECMSPFSRRSAVEPFRAMDVMSTALALEREGRRIIHLAVGEPGAPTPKVVREADGTYRAVHAVSLGTCSRNPGTNSR